MKVEGLKRERKTGSLYASLSITLVQYATSLSVYRAAGASLSSFLPSTMPPSRSAAMASQDNIPEWFLLKSIYDQGE